MELGKVEWESLLVRIGVEVITNGRIHLNGGAGVSLGQGDVVSIAFTLELDVLVGTDVLRSIDRTLSSTSGAEFVDASPVSTELVVVEATFGGIGNSKKEGKSKGFHFYLDLKFYL